MRRIFPILATLVSLLLMAGFYSGLIRRVDDLGQGVRLAAAAAAMAVHAVTFAYLWLTGRRVVSMVGLLGLPGWVNAQSDKNRRKALLFQVSGSVVAMCGVGLLALEWWHPIVLGSSVSFQVGLFIGEAMIVANQSRLLDDLAHVTGPVQVFEGS